MCVILIENVCQMTENVCETDLNGFEFLEYYLNNNIGLC